MNEIKLLGPDAIPVDAINHAMQRDQERAAKLLEQEQETKSTGIERAPRTAILDRELYIPYQCAVDAILDDSFDEQPVIVQMLQGWMAQAFRRFAQKNKAYQDVVLTCTTKLQLKEAGRSFGQIQPKEHRPNANHVFTTLRKLKQIGKPTKKGDIDYYLIRDFPDQIKKTFIYPAMDAVMPSLLPYLKKNRIQLLLGNDFVFALPEALREHPEFKDVWDKMPCEQGIDGGYIYVSDQLHKFKFI